MPTVDASVCASSSAPQHILVVDGDDEESNRTRAALESAGYRVTTADLPDIGLVRRIEPDAVVVGLMFRGQAIGLDFLEQHAADPVTAPVPVVVHAAAANLDTEQWRRLTALAPAVEPLATSSGGLVTEVKRLLAGAMVA
jgi:CheY-like chemotaxis protein